jgi:hypothetical protein
MRLYRSFVYSVFGLEGMREHPDNNIIADITAAARPVNFIDMQLV